MPRSIWGPVAVADALALAAVAAADAKTAVVAAATSAVLPYVHAVDA